MSNPCTPPSATRAAPSNPPPILPPTPRRAAVALDKALNYQVCILSGTANRPLASEIASHLGLPLAAATVSAFSDGETRVAIDDSVRGKDVFIVQPTAPPVNDHVMQLLLLADALSRASAKRITAVVPYYGYARQDRKRHPRVPISARLLANLIQAAGVHRVLAFELHAGQIQGFFNLPVDHIFAMPILLQYFQDHPAPPRDARLVVVSPDAGAVERARRLASALDAALAIIYKRRSAPNVAHVLCIIGDVRDAHCLIVDDMVDTAGTLCNAAETLKENGARSVRACCVHAILSGPAVERIAASCIEELVVTNSIEIKEETKAALPRITQLSCGKLIAETIRRIHREESVSTMFTSE
ncbi:probable phosphoribosyl diphosphate synthetase ribose-phosphate pyrophosphokinase [Chondrus crispus]|uniref:ribose-phosphate diphosphokinase n=1 Tax=Chondrus crispus TaxID=2769 RepID=R7QPG3_CHOCR|nr:probable phosphoribosyl diphosphate synthetase ribose-phosphate pyrophosphokinase [Chondrus crispus]CDF39663.1 probable phosphoribosyl diphosphate synthetase ribose-phosphate pyrophosphokinase [Chondrus crispus]|eukprot:XP_005709957.1 probable phosphoribosyl diphosphate synthetase ribose-phosphate pyrophosphokinase [Chondrus crispus]